MNKYTVSLYKHSLVRCNIRGVSAAGKERTRLVVTNTRKQPKQGKQTFGFEYQARHFGRHVT